MYVITGIDRYAKNKSKNSVLPFSIYFVIQQMFTSYYLPSTALDDRKTVVNKMENLAFRKLTFWGGKSINK